MWERSTQHEKKLFLRKTRLKLFSMKNRKKISLTPNQRCRHHTKSIQLRFLEVDFFNHFFEVDKVE